MSTCNTGEYNKYSLPTVKLPKITMTENVTQRKLPNVTPSNRIILTATTYNNLNDD